MGGGGLEKETCHDIKIASIVLCQLMTTYKYSSSLQMALCGESVPDGTVWMMFFRFLISVV